MITFLSSSGASRKEVKRASGAGAELKEQGLHGSAHVSTITTTPLFQRVIRAFMGLTQPPPANTEAETCKDSTITHLTNSLSSQNNYRLQR